MSGEPEDFRDLSRATLEFKCGMLAADNRELTQHYLATAQRAQDYKKLASRYLQDLAASEATTGPDARVRMPAAGGSRQLAQAPAPPRPSSRPNAPRSDNTSDTPIREHRRPMRDHGPRMERSTPTQTTANRDLTCTPIDRRGTNRQNAARAGAYHATTNALASAPAQASRSAPPHPADSRFHDRDTVNSLIREAGVRPSTAMTQEDLDLDRNTPDISIQSFKSLFGGDATQERPQSKWGIVCVNMDAQPYAPRSPGESGLLFIYPDVALLEDTCEHFHLFLNKKKSKDMKLMRSVAQVRYIGTYTKVPIQVVRAEVGPDEWLRLPSAFRKTWLKRIQTSTKDDIRAALARICLRKEGQPPSTEAIRKWLMQNRTTRVSVIDIRAAFDCGEEKIEFEVIKYVRYDRGIATEQLGSHD